MITSPVSTQVSPYDPNAWVQQHYLTPHDPKAAARPAFPAPVLLHSPTDAAYPASAYPTSCYPPSAYPSSAYPTSAAPSEHQAWYASQGHYPPGTTAASDYHLPHSQGNSGQLTGEH